MFSADVEYRAAPGEYDHLNAGGFLLPLLGLLAVLTIMFGFDLPPKYVFGSLRSFSRDGLASFRCSLKKAFTRGLGPYALILSPSRRWQSVQLSCSGFGGGAGLRMGLKIYLQQQPVMVSRVSTWMGTACCITTQYFDL
jgi:hypothetical protein